MTRIARLLHQLSSKPVLILIFILLAAPTTLRLSRLTPPGQAPDEPAHLARAAGLLHGAILAQRKYGYDQSSPAPALITGVKVNPGLMRIATNKAPTPQDLYQTQLTDKPGMMRLTYNTPPQFTAIDNTAQYFPAAYLPATAGLAVGLAFHQPPRRVFQFARYANTIAYLLLGAVAIFLTPAGAEPILITILLLPISLFLAGTVSEDGTLIALACLSAATFARDPEKHPKSRWAALLSLTLILGAKIPYLPLAFLALIPIASRNLRPRLFQLACVILPVLTWAAIIIIFVYVPFLRPPYHPGALYQGAHSILLNSTNTAENLKILLARPSRFLTMPLALINRAAIQWAREIVGVLGILQLQFPDPFYTKWCCALAISSFGALFTTRPACAPLKASLTTTIFVIAIIVLTIWSIIISMYLSWTNVGSPTIEGLQGRYFVLLLPLLSLAIPRTRLPLPPIIPLLPTIALATYDLHYLPFRIWQNFAMQHLS